MQGSQPGGEAVCATELHGSKLPVFAGISHVSALLRPLSSFPELGAHVSALLERKQYFPARLDPEAQEGDPLSNIPTEASSQRLPHTRHQSTPEKTPRILT